MNSSISYKTSSNFQNPDLQITIRLHRSFPILSFPFPSRKKNVLAKYVFFWVPGSDRNASTAAVRVLRESEVRMGDAMAFGFSEFHKEGCVPWVPRKAEANALHALGASVVCTVGQNLQVVYV